MPAIQARKVSKISEGKAKLHTV